jgi:TolA-binding protein
MRSRLVFFASLAMVALSLVLMVNGAFCLTSQDVPAADLPTTNPSPGIPLTPTPSAVGSPAVSQSLPTQINDLPSGDADAPDASGGKDSLSDGNAPADVQDNGATSTSESQASGEPTSLPPALDASALPVSPELGNESLDSEINKAAAPSLAASLRLTESARKRLNDGQVDDAMRELARAISLDPSDAFAYYYLGRAYLARRNYTQALTFFRRAEIGFNGRPGWTGETLSYEGICDEELGKPTEAAEAYKRALAVSPNNFRARVGYGRLASITGQPENLDAPAPDQDLAMPAPSAPDESPPQEQPPPTAPE